MNYTSEKRTIIYGTDNLRLLNQLFVGGYLTVDLADVAYGGRLQVKGEFMADEIELRRDGIILSGTMMEQFEPGPKASLAIQGELEYVYWRANYIDDVIESITGAFEIDGHLVNFTVCYDLPEYGDLPIYKIQRDLNIY